MKNPSNILIDGSKFGLDWLKIYWYGGLIVVGIILAYILCSIEAKRRRLHKDCVIDLALIIVPLGAIFARIYYVVFALDAFIKPGMSFGEILLGMINVRDGGLAIYGAIIGGVLGMFIYGRVKRIHFLSITDLIMPSVALAQAIGRWGNFFNQEAYGRVISDGFPPYFPLAVKIDECRQSCCADLPSNLNNIHYATFFYESCWCFIIFIVLWFILRKIVKHRGDITMAYLIMYGAERALVEGLRTDSLMLGSLRVSQLLSVVLVVFAAAYLIIRAILEKKKGRVLQPVREVYYGDMADRNRYIDGGAPEEPATAEPSDEAAPETEADEPAGPEEIDPEPDEIAEAGEAAAAPDEVAPPEGGDMPEGDDE